MSKLMTELLFGQMATNGLGLAVRQGNRITKVQNITKDE